MLRTYGSNTILKIAIMAPNKFPETVKKLRKNREALLLFIYPITIPNLKYIDKTR